MVKVINRGGPRHPRGLRSCSRCHRSHCIVRYGDVGLGGWSCLPGHVARHREERRRASSQAAAQGISHDMGRAARRCTYVMRGVTVVIDTSEECCRCISTNVLCQQVTASWVLLKKV